MNEILAVLIAFVAFVIMAAAADAIETYILQLRRWKHEDSYINRPARRLGRD